MVCRRCVREPSGSADPREHVGGVRITQYRTRRSIRLGCCFRGGWWCGVLVQFAREEAEQHVLGLVEVEPCRDEHPADPVAAPGQRTQTTAAAAAAAPIDLMVTEQRVQRSDAPAWGGADPAIAPGSHGGCQGTVQRLPQQLVAGLMHVRAHAGVSGSGRSHDVIQVPMRTVASTRSTRDTVVLITGVA